MRRAPHRAAAVLPAILALAACTNDPGFRGVSGVRTIIAAEAAACTYVINIRAAPGVYGPLAQQGLEYTRNIVLADAQKAGANAVVFDEVSPGTLVTEVTATAYRCP